MTPERWECGSEFHWPRPTASGDDGGSPPWSHGELLFSGRDALRLLLRHGARERSWRRLWVPEYYCQHVMAALVQPGLDLMPYPDDPTRTTPQLPAARPGDAILVLNYFGLRAPVHAPPCDGVDVIEDHSHDPWSPWACTSSADFCIASLRKTLPITDGGVLWSPRGHEVPRAPRLTSQRRRVAGAKLTAMILKALYLDGQPISKREYRAIAVRAERGLSVPGISAASEVARAVLASFDTARWRNERASNHAVLADRLAKLEGLRVLAPAHGAGVPFSCVLVLDAAGRRDALRAGLIASNVFPAVLWPLETTVVSVGDARRELSRRVLSIHCDGRYTAADMRRVGEIVESALAS